MPALGAGTAAAAGTGSATLAEQTSADLGGTTGGGVGAGTATMATGDLGGTEPLGPADGAGVGLGTTAIKRRFFYGGAGAALDAISIPIEGSVSVEPVLPVTPPLGVRTQPGVVVTMPQPALQSGQPIMPDTWCQPTSAFTENDGGYTVTYPPPPIITIPPRPPGSGGGDLDNLRWVASDAQGGFWVNNWPEVNGGPAWKSHYPYKPYKTDRTVPTGPNRFTAGKRAVYDAVVVANWEEVEHMYIDLGETFKNPFTWVVCAIILSYPTARYGHYLIDTGYTPTSRNTIERNWGYVRPIPGEGGHRAALLEKRNDSVMSTGGSGNGVIEGNKLVRHGHDWTPQPRVYWGVFNSDSSHAGVKGRNYERWARGKVNDREQRRFVWGRRSQYLSCDLASHVAVFEIRFFPFAMSKAQIDGQYNNLSSKYDFNRYRI